MQTCHHAHRAACQTQRARAGWRALSGCPPAPLTAKGNQRLHAIRLGQSERPLRASCSPNQSAWPDMDLQGRKPYAITPRTDGVVTPPARFAHEQRNRKDRPTRPPCGFSLVGARGFEPPISPTRTVTPDLLNRGSHGRPSAVSVSTAVEASMRTAVVGFQSLDCCLLIW